MIKLNINLWVSYADHASNKVCQASAQTIDYHVSVSGPIMCPKLKYG